MHRESVPADKYRICCCVEEGELCDAVYSVQRGQAVPIRCRSIA